MKTTTSTTDFQVTKNRIMGRLTHCTNPVELYHQLKKEAEDIVLTHQNIIKAGEGDKISFAYSPSREEQEALLGIDRGISAAQEAIKGRTRDIDEL